jgi:hypothetical protein
MTDSSAIFIKDDQRVKLYFADITEVPRREALTLLAKSGQSDTLPIDLGKICEYEAMPLKFTQIDDPKIAARLVLTEGEWFIEVDDGGNGDSTFSTDTTTRRRQRFSVAHELGHYKFKSHCDNDLQGVLLSGHNPNASSYLLIRESQANEFATELLLPYPLLKPLLKTLDFKNEFFKSVENISDQFDVSMTATLKRIATILDIPVIAIHFAPDGKAYQLPSYSPEYKSAKFFFERGRTIPDNTYAANMFDGKTTASRGRKAYPDSSIWFPNRRGDDFKVVEWALTLGNYGILVFLELIEKDEGKY